MIQLMPLVLIFLAGWVPLGVICLAGRPLGLLLLAGKVPLGFQWLDGEALSLFYNVYRSILCFLDLDSAYSFLRISYFVYMSDLWGSVRDILCTFWAYGSVRFSLDVPSSLYFSMLLYFSLNSSLFLDSKFSYCRYLSCLVGL